MCESINSPDRRNKCTSQILGSQAVNWKAVSFQAACVPATTPVQTTKNGTVRSSLPSRNGRFALQTVFLTKTLKFLQANALETQFFRLWYPLGASRATNALPRALRRPAKTPGNTSRRPRESRNPTNSRDLGNGPNRCVRLFIPVNFTQSSELFR